MQHSAYQIAEQIVARYILNASNKQTLALARALLKQRARADELQAKLNEHARRQQLQITVVAPNASARLTQAVEQFLDNKRRLNQSIYEGTVGEMRSALVDVKRQTTTHNNPQR